MQRSLGTWAAALGFLAVALGAFGAHALKERLSAEALGWWQTGVLYQGLHALALLGVALAAAARPGRLLHVAGVCFALGVLVFSGSLYVLALTGARWLGAVTPLGGLLLLAGWLALLGAARRRPTDAPPPR